MKILMFGAGYVGLVTATCFSEMGNNVLCVDVNKEKIDKLNNGIIPIYEPGLEEMIKRNKSQGRIEFTSDFDGILEDKDICFIAVGTPSKEDGSANLNYVFEVARFIGKNLSKEIIVVDKSTVPVGTGEEVKKVISEELDKRGKKIKFSVVSNPEFLKEGAAIDDFMRPDRIIIGADDEEAKNTMISLYKSFVSNGHPIITMDVKSAELTKYAANVMLATRISFMNELARVCDKTGADVLKIREGIGTDSRIGMPFLYAGPGYGGSCFPKDVKEFIQTGDRLGINLKIAKAVNTVNEEQKHYLSDIIINRFKGDFQGKTFGIWGLSFKPQTDDMREAPSIEIIKDLLSCGAKIKAYDPEAMEEAKKIFNNIEYADSQMDAIRDADALVLVTEWKEFRSPDFDLIKKTLKQPIIFDGRNQYDGEELKAKGFEYYCIGRGQNE